jgi:hypothetical protein
VQHRRQALRPCSVSTGLAMLTMDRQRRLLQATDARCAGPSAKAVIA